MKRDRILTINLPSPKGMEEFAIHEPKEFRKPIGPTEMRAMCSAPTCACSIISFSPPSRIDGYIWIE